MQGYPFEVQLQVRYKDLDSMGHVNNAVYLTYFEEVRLAFFREVFGLRDGTDFSFILARAEIDYRRPLRLFEPLRAGLRVESVGRTSFVFGYQLCTVDGQGGEEVVASGRSVQVCFDYQRQLKVPVPDSFRAGVAPYLVSAPAAPGHPGR